MKVTIVGGSGFIGTSLARRLVAKAGVELNNIDLAQSRAFPDITKSGDVTRLESFENLIPEGAVVINLAAEHRDDVWPRSRYHDVNVGGAENICTAARRRGVRHIIFTSSVAVYGFAPVGTDESGCIKPINDYGKTKYQAELIFRAWQAEDPQNRTLVIVRPTVVFGEGNRGNVYNLMRQISSSFFVMVGAGTNRKSIAYVENVAAFLERALDFTPGTYTFNFTDHPDMTMNELVDIVSTTVGRRRSRLRIPKFLGTLIGNAFDIVARITHKNFAISGIRVQKFCANSVYASSIKDTGFVSPVPLLQALDRTVRYEFCENHADSPTFQSE